MSILKQIIKKNIYEVDSAQSKISLKNKVLNKTVGLGVNTKLKTPLQKANLKKVNLKKVNAVLDKQSALLSHNSIEKSQLIVESKVWENKLSSNLAIKDTQSLLKVRPNKLTKKTTRLEDKRALKEEVPLGKTGYNWVLNKVHPHHYSNILGYRHKNTIINPSITLHGVRRVLHYLKSVIENYSLEKKPSVMSEQNDQLKADLIVVIESSILTAGSQDKTQVSSATLVAYSLLRLQQFSCLKILPKTTKETIRYLTTGETKSLCGVLMLNPAKSVLGTLADTLFNKKNKKLSAGNAIGTLCSKKGIPLISLCDISSPLTLCTYPIICDTRNVKSIYYVFDLLTYGLNQLTQSSAPLAGDSQA